MLLLLSFCVQRSMWAAHGPTWQVVAGDLPTLKSSLTPAPGSYMRVVVKGLRFQPLRVKLVVFRSQPVSQSTSGSRHSEQLWRQLHIFVFCASFISFLAYAYLQRTCSLECSSAGPESPFSQISVALGTSAAPPAAEPVGVAGTAVGSGDGDGDNDGDGDGDGDVDGDGSGDGAAGAKPMATAEVPKPPPAHCTAELITAADKCQRTSRCDDRGCVCCSTLFCSAVFWCACFSCALCCSVLCALALALCSVLCSVIQYFTVVSLIFPLLLIAVGYSTWP